MQYKTKKNMKQNQQYKHLQNKQTKQHTHAHNTTNAKRYTDTNNRHIKHTLKTNKNKQTNKQTNIT